MNKKNILLEAADAQVERCWKKVSEHPDHKSSKYSKEYSRLLTNLCGWMQVQEDLSSSSNAESTTTTEANDKDFEPDDLFFDTDR